MRDTHGNFYQPPHVVIFGFRVKQFGVPYGETWLDWPHGFIYKMNYLTEVFMAYRSKDNVKGDLSEWENRNPDYHKIILDVTSLRIRAKHGTV